MISQGSKMQGTVERVTFGFEAFLTEFKTSIFTRRKTSWLPVCFAWR